MSNWIIVAILVIMFVEQMMSHKEQRKENDTLQKILCELKEIRRIVDMIWKALAPARSATLIFEGDEMAATILVGATANSVFTEFSGPNGTGSVVPPSGPITYASDNTAVATVDSNGVVTGVTQGTANISGLDPASANQVTASDVITVNAVTPPVAESATLALTAN